MAIKDRPQLIKIGRQKAFDNIRTEIILLALHRFFNQHEVSIHFFHLFLGQSQYGMFLLGSEKRNESVEIDVHLLQKIGRNHHHLRQMETGRSGSPMNQVARCTDYQIVDIPFVGLQIDVQTRFSLLSEPDEQPLKPQRMAEERVNPFTQIVLGMFYQQVVAQALGMGEVQTNAFDGYILYLMFHNSYTQRKLSNKNRNTGHFVAQFFL